MQCWRPQPQTATPSSAVEAVEAAEAEAVAAVMSLEAVAETVGQKGTEAAAKAPSETATVMGADTAARMRARRRRCCWMPATSTRRALGALTWWVQAGAAA
eukprot:248074-Chlamydomonas_euryale.AAC.1